MKTPIQRNPNAEFSCQQIVYMYSRETGADITLPTGEVRIRESVTGRLLTCPGSPEVPIFQIPEDPLDFQRASNCDHVHPLYYPLSGNVANISETRGRASELY